MLTETSPLAAAPSPAGSDLTRLILVTLAALATFRIGNLIPIPGIDTQALASLGSGPQTLGAIERLSVCALGIVPLFSALILAELGKLVLPTVRFDKAVLPVALIFAIFQASGVAIALQDFPNLVTEPGRDFHLTTTATLVGGAAFSIWLAQVITQRGLGNGVWWLFVLPQVVALPGMLAALGVAARTGALSTATLVLSLAVTVAIVSAVAMMLHPKDANRSAGGTDLLWPPILGPLLAGYLAVPGLAFAPSSFSETWSQIFSPGQPAGLAITAVLVAAIAVIYARRHGRTNAALQAAVLASAVVAPEIFITHFGMPWLLTGSALVILTVLMSPLVRAARA
jgi:hypothetical protein